MQEVKQQPMTSESRFTWFVTCVVGDPGTKWGNGMNLQSFVPWCAVASQLGLFSEPETQNNPPAVRVGQHNGKKVGYLPAPRAPEVLQAIKSGQQCTAFVTEVLRNKKNEFSGLRICVCMAPPGMTCEQIVNRFERLKLIAEPPLKNP